MKINILILQRMNLVNNFHVIETMGKNDLVLLILFLMCVKGWDPEVCSTMLDSDLRLLGTQVDT